MNVVHLSPLLAEWQAHRAFLGRILAADCRPSISSSVNRALDAAVASPTNTTLVLNLLQTVSLGCDSSHLPFVGRDVWWHHSDVALLPSAAPDHTRALARCQQRSLAASRACVVFVQSQLAAAAAEAAVQYLAAHPAERLVFVSSSHDDHCVPFMSYDSSRPPPPSHAATHLLSEPRFVQWFTENPCVAHPKIAALPIGAKFNWRVPQFDAEDKVPVKARLLNALIGAATGAVARRRLLMVGLSADSTGNPFYVAHRGIRARHVAAMALTANETLPHMSHAEYLRELSAHQFAWSPPGRGIDAHRTWEAALLGCVPVVASSPISELYDPAFAFEVDDFSTITRASLEAASRRYAGRRAVDWLRPEHFALHWLLRIARAANDSVV